MAVKKVKETKATEEVVVDNKEVVKEPEVLDVQETPVVEIEEPKEEPKIEVEEEAKVVDTTKKPKTDVKIKMREDHRCTVAMETYDLKKGKTYTVPRNVKNILNKAGLLAPLN